MRHNALLKLLLAAFFLYFAWPYIPEATSQLERIFWGGWLGLFFLVVSANSAVLLQLISPIKLTQHERRVRQTDKN